jgi:hypothetical protein
VRLHQKDASFAKLFPHTHFFEVQSAEAATSYGVWVTLPPHYHSNPDRRYPAVYQTDGNLAFPQTVPNHSLADFDFLSPLAPFVQVSVGRFPAIFGPIASSAPKFSHYNKAVCSAHNQQATRKQRPLLWKTMDCNTC